jgi:hypothetical protein
MQFLSRALGKIIIFLLIFCGSLDLCKLSETKAAKSHCIIDRAGHLFTLDNGRLFPMPRKQWNRILYASAPIITRPLYDHPTLNALITPQN